MGCHLYLPGRKACACVPAPLHTLGNISEAREPVKDGHSEQLGHVHGLYLWWSVLTLWQSS